MLNGRPIFFINLKAESDDLKKWKILSAELSAGEFKDIKPEEISKYFEWLLGDDAIKFTSETKIINTFEDYIVGKTLEIKD